MPVGTVLPPDRNLRPGFNIINGQLIEVRAPSHMQQNSIRMAQNFQSRNLPSASQKKPQSQGGASWESTLSTLSDPRDDLKMMRKQEPYFKTKENKAPKVYKPKLIWDPIGT